MIVELKHYPELGYTGCFEAEEYHVNVKAYRHVGETSQGQILFQAETGSTENLAEASVWFEMIVKWDGCANWIVPCHQQGMMSHICGYKDLVEFGSAIKSAYKESHSLMKNSDIGSSEFQG